MAVPDSYRVLESHEWHKLDGNVVTLGITQVAADELTDITYVSLPKVGAKITAGQRFGEIESVKATSDLYSGISGEVVEVNAALNDDPGTVNREPFEGGWMMKVKVEGDADFKKIASAADYNAKH